MVKFTEIANKLDYPYNVKAQLSTLHTNIINYAITNFTGTMAEKRKILNVMNTISYILVVGDNLPHNWNSADPFENIDLVDDTACRTALGALYIMPKNIIWDIEANLTDTTDNITVQSASIKPPKTKITSRSRKHDSSQMQEASSEKSNSYESSKSDLYLSPPGIPRFDITKPWKSGIINNTKYSIFPSLPVIPTVQSEISITTDLDQMSDTDLLRLFPSKFIATRPATLYSRIAKIPFDDLLGILLPIEGFTTQEIVNNIVRYPHLFRLYRMVDNQAINFYSNIELDGQLYKITDVWHTLPDTKLIPYQVDYIKEYVIRRYLLERDLRNIVHRYPIYGTFDPFLTLFMPATNYAKYTDDTPVELARQCVTARIAYKQSRNPILKKLQEVNNA